MRFLALSDENVDLKKSALPTGGWIDPIRAPILFFRDGIPTKFNYLVTGNSNYKSTQFLNVCTKRMYVCTKDLPCTIFYKIAVWSQKIL